MKKSSKIILRVIAAFIGILWAVFYWFWTMALTGGGHGNFVWLGILVLVEFGGLFFPLMAVLMLDLRSKLVQTIFGALTMFNIIGSIVLIFLWIQGFYPFSDGDYLKTDRTLIMLSAPVHFLPAAIFFTVLIIAICRDHDWAIEDLI